MAYFTRNVQKAVSIMFVKRVCVRCLRLRQHCQLTPRCHGLVWCCIQWGQNIVDTDACRQQIIARRTIGAFHLHALWNHLSNRGLSKLLEEIKIGLWNEIWSHMAIKEELSCYVGTTTDMILHRHAFDKPNETHHFQIFNKNTAWRSTFRDI